MHGAGDTPRRPGFGRGVFGASPCTSGSRTQFGSVGVVDQFSVAAVFARAMVSSCGERVGVCALKLPFCGPRTEPKPDSTANSASFRDCIGAVTIRMQFFGTRPVVVLVEFCDRQNFHFRWGDAVLRRVAASWPAAHGDRGAPLCVASSRNKPRVATPSIAPPSWRPLGGGL